jgi:hypothetical protein
MLITKEIQELLITDQIYYYYYYYYLLQLGFHPVHVHAVLMKSIHGNIILSANCRYSLPVGSLNLDIKFQSAMQKICQYAIG